MARVKQVLADLALGQLANHSVETLTRWAVAFVILCGCFESVVFKSQLKCRHVSDV